ncbi:TetR/AcrR family transcriptional regulator [Pseudofrankia sp. EUN1h]|uniref:TetR/AcrR family transcriptional regulator n=2 Tax=Pseudofrankia TaxID=2994363 RepID=UPI000234B979|nr:TetR/AcrR family transcriptional regulator [Pseudofrankia sp. EUN1h]OHV35977.1 TetR family transcriptional regulator [Pseudofrankia sp. EUN1h]
MVPATAKGEATRAFLLTTAARVFAERGYVGTTMADLIGASGLTKGAFYFYFRSKADLALAVLTDQKTRWLEWVTTRLADQPRAVDQLGALLPAMLDLIASEPGAWSVTRLTRELATESALADTVGEPMAEWVEMVADIVRRGQADGDLRADLRPDDVAVVLVAAFDGLKAMSDILDGPLATSRFPDRARTLNRLVELALRGPGQDGPGNSA